MKIINKKGQVFGKINVIDILVVFILIFGIYSIVNISGDFIKQPKLNDKISFVLTATQVKPFLVETLKDNDIVSVSKTEDFFGNLSKITYKDSVAYTSDKDGNIVLTSRPDTYFLELMVTSAGKKEGDSAKIGDKTYTIGQILNFRVGDTILDLEIKKIELSK